MSFRGHPLVSPIAWTAAILFAIDMVTNLVDYAFHVYLGWSLTPGEFATVQTINALLLIVVTAFAVLQPVVARYVAAFNVQAKREGRQTNAAHDGGGWRDTLLKQSKRKPVTPRSRTIFQRYMRQGLLLGVLLFLLAWLIRFPLAAWLNVPNSALAAASFMLLFVLLRPVTFGMLQGQQQFVAFGSSRTSYAVVRLLLAVVFISILGGGAVAAIAAFPLAALLSLATALFFLGRDVWRPGEEIAQSLMADGWRLSLAALIAYTAFMSLQNVDLIWANRLFPAPAAGAYASAVVLRRVLVVLPGAISVILYPRLVAQVTAHHLPDRILAKALMAIISITAALTLFYFLLGPWLVSVMFGEEYSGAAPLLGWMGVGMIAFAISSIWLNLFIATRPWPYVVVLAIAALVQLLLLTLFNNHLTQLIAVFVLIGWLLAFSGLVLYWFWLRPDLRNANLTYWSNNDVARASEVEAA